MSVLNIGPQGAYLHVANTSPWRTQDSLTFDLLVDGRRRFFWTPMSLMPGRSATVAVKFLTSVDAPGIVLCGDHPVGIVDNPEPVVNVTVKDLPVE